MAILQQTLVSKSIWIGTSSSTQNWSDYDTSHNSPFLIIRDDYNALEFDSNLSTNVLYLNTTSIRSRDYVAGFDPTNLGNRGFAINLVDNRYIAEFDDLWIRGSMNVHQFIINQIRATNGSLWVNDSAKAISVQADGSKLILQFEPLSVLPFKKDDIIRSKRWIVNSASIVNWDIVVIISDIVYSDTNPNITASFSNPYWLNPSDSLDSLLAAKSSDWVRIGSTSDLDRQGGIYLTSGDLSSPYIDIYDGVSTVLTGYNQSSYDNTSVDLDTLKIRLGRLDGVTRQQFGGALSGYGLYAENAFLKGRIVANQGGSLAGWTISNYYLTSGNITISSLPVNQYFGIGTNTYNTSGIYFGSSESNYKFSLVQGTNKVLWDGSNFGISTSNFTLSQGSITATSGLIGGWNISSNDITSTASNSVIKLRNTKSDAWDVVSRTGVDYEANTSLFGTIAEWFDTDAEQLDLFYNATYVTSDIGQHIVRFNSAQTTSGLNFAKSKQSISIPANTTFYYAFKQIAISPGFVNSEYLDTLVLTIANESKTASQVVLFGPGYAQTRSNYYFSYTNITNDTEDYDMYFHVKSSGRTAFTPQQYRVKLSSMKYMTSSGYTELNPHGLLVWNGPNNYIKFTTDNNNQYAIIAVDELLVDGQSIKGGGGSSGSSGGGVDGTGTTDTIPIWIDNNTLGDSHLTQDSINQILISDYAISAPTYTGAGFQLTSTTNGSSAIGNLPANADITGLSIKDVLDVMLAYTAPTLTSPKFYSGSLNISSGTYTEIGYSIGHPCTFSVTGSSVTNVKPGTYLSLTNNISWTNITSLTPAQNVIVTSSAIYNPAYYRSSPGSAQFIWTMTSSLSTIITSTYTLTWRYPVLSFHSDSSSITQGEFNSICATLPGTSAYKLAKSLSYSSNMADGDTLTFSSSGIVADRYVWVAYPSSWVFIPTKFQMQPDGSTGSWVDYSINTGNSNLNYASYYNSGVTVSYRLIRTELKTGASNAPSVKLKQ